MFSFDSLRRTFWVLFLLIAFDMTTGRVADARVGGGRSIGRSSSGFGSRRYSPPPSRSSQPQNNPNAPQGRPAENSSGGFMRGLAGGIAGGFLGSMLFSSLGHGAGIGGNGGGVGLFEILLMAGLIFIGFRWWKGRQQTASSYAGASSGFDHSQPNVFSSNTPTLDPEEASDIFFKIQGAWTRRDLSSVKDLVGGEMLNILNQDLDALKRNQRINRLENISIRKTDVSESWQDGGVDHATVHFTANLLDYSVDEKTGQVVDGSASLPVKFEEDWTFAKSPLNQWCLVGIQQA